MTFVQEVEKKIEMYINQYDKAIAKGNLPHAIQIETKIAIHQSLLELYKQTHN